MSVYPIDLVIDFINDSRVYFLQLLCFKGVLPTYLRLVLKIILIFYFLQKLWFQHTWPVLEHEIRSQEVLAAVLEPVLFLVKECSPEEYGSIILPALK